MRSLRLLLPAIATLAAACASRATRGTGVPDPAIAVRSLLDADRTFAARSADTTLPEAIARMFASDVLLPAPNGEIARGIDAGRALLGANPENARSRVTWTPIRGGVSGDAQHGFTYGYQEVTRADGTTVPGKYVAYWTREGGDGRWRVSVYRRFLRPAGEVSREERASALPARGVAPDGDAAARAALAVELAAAERAFSRAANGGASIGAAFASFGDATAANVGGMSSASFIFGPDSIAANVQRGVGPGQTITWEPLETRVASSGDVGVTIGVITFGTKGEPAKAVKVSYFTIWRRDDRSKPWRYVAE